MNYLRDANLRAVPTVLVAQAGDVVHITNAVCAERVTTGMWCRYGARTILRPLSTQTRDNREA